MKIPGLESRFFDNAAAALPNLSSGALSSSQSSSSSSGEGQGEDGEKKKKQKDKKKLGDTNGNLLLLVKGEDATLAGANTVRWIIKYEDIAMGEQLGMGSYGVVYRGRWKGIDVAVKHFIKQKMDERNLLEFRAEVACLSELRHPNIVLFIGACIRMPHLCLVTEWVTQGSLKELLASPTRSKLTWLERMGILRDAARGVHYLHSLEPCIVHRDLKSSNLLVDESLRIKVADFGLARIKEDNVTMTRCGTPAWTAPEVIRGEHYTESADVYSFGIVMWEVLTGKQPYAGCNFMNVTINILEGKRPLVPSDCPTDFEQMMTSCWKAKPKKRPSMDDVLKFLDAASMGGSEV